RLPTVRFVPKRQPKRVSRTAAPGSNPATQDHHVDGHGQREFDPQEEEIMQLLGHRKRPKMQLLDLPDDILAVVCRHLNKVSRASLAMLSCTTKTVAAIAQPVLFSTLFVPSYAKLPRMLQTLSNRPDLAKHVHSLCVSYNFISGNPFFLVDIALNTCRIGSGSNIISMQLAQRFVDLSILERFPIPLLTRLATICPALMCIDLAGAGTTAQSAPIILFGILDLVNILKHRRGRLVTPYDVPIAAVLVKDRIMHVPRTTGVLHDQGWGRDLYLVTGTIDWNRKRIDVSNWISDADSDEKSRTMALVPFCDLVSPSLEEQSQWTIRNVSCQLLYERDHDVRPWRANGWILSAPDLWARVGIRLGKDHVFDFSKRGAVAGTIKYATVFADVAMRALNARPCFNVHSKVTELILEAGGPEQYATLPASQLSIVCSNQLACFTDLVSPLSTKSVFHSLTKLTIGAGFAFRAHNCAPVFKRFAASLPNLVELAISSILSEMDAILVPLDCLIRRPSKPLQDLRLTAYVSATATNPLLTSPALLKYITSGLETHSTSRSLLSNTRSTRGHLHTLELKIEGPRCVRVPSHEIPTVAIHPGLLHGIDRLELWGFKLFILPPRFATPDGPSFLPLAYIHQATCKSSLADRTLLTLAHVTLRALRSLHLSTKCILAQALPTNLVEATQLHLVAPLLPTCPRLQHFIIRTDYAGVAFTAHDIANMLARFPSLAFAQFGCTNLDARQLQWVVETIINGEPERKRTLRDLELYNIKAARRLDRGWVLSGPHVTHLASSGAPLPLPLAPVRLTPTSVELDLKAHLYLGEPSMETRCGSCCRPVKSISGFLALEENKDYSSVHGIYPFHDLDLTDEPASRCPKCAPLTKFVQLQGECGWVEGWWSILVEVWFGVSYGVLALNLLYHHTYVGRPQYVYLDELLPFMASSFFSLMISST
ncbi:hypothetical protein BCR44DRAFT_91778, partial [Catenaria anguillulae PL171]